MAVALPVLDPFAFSDHTTRYRKNVKPVPEKPAASGLFVLKEAGNNAKLGKVMTKSRWKGMKLFALTLEERATCWEGCQNLSRCYGDNMPFAHRYKHGPALERALDRDVFTLSSRKQTRDGFIVRLHVLGDFYSVAYVHYWGALLKEYPALRLFGYTHHRHASPIGRAVSDLVHEWPLRTSFLRSDADEADDPLPKAMTVLRGAEPVEGTVFCPEQTGRSPTCATCGLCMGGRVSVTFIDHSRELKHTIDPYKDVVPW